MRKITVIISCYNVEKYIDRCLTSITVQTIGIENLEIILIDDASTDNTWEHLQIWEQKYCDNIILIRQDTNSRQGTARNIGLQYASADWIAFVDADDWLEPDYFEQLYRPALQYACDVVCCSEERDFSDTLTYFNKKDREVEEDWYLVPDTEAVRKEVIATRILGGEAAWGKLVRKKFLIDHEIFFPEHLAYEDRIWYTLMHVYASGIYIVGKKLYHYFVNDQSIVLKKNVDHHIDWLTVCLMKWTEFERRGLLEKYRQELEFDCMDDALGFLKIIILRYDHPSFSLFQLVREILHERVPDYKANPYYMRYDGIYPILLEKLYEEPFSKNDFQRLVDFAKKAWEVQ